MAKMNLDPNLLRQLLVPDPIKVVKYVGRLCVSNIDIDCTAFPFINCCFGPC